MTKRMIAAMLALTIAAACVTSCGSQSEDASKAETTTAAAAEADAKVDGGEGDADADDGAAEDELKAPVADAPFKIADGWTEDMYTRAVYSKGDTTRLKEKIKYAIDLKADDSMKASEKGAYSTRVAFIGDSITAGTQASTDNQYTKVLQKWWEDEISYFAMWTNAGIGATDSYLAVHRVDAEVLADNPDIIFIEFINDQNNDFYKSTMDSLIRKCLSQPNNPAVILLEMTQEDGTCPQPIHTDLAEYYGLPVISYHDAVLPEIEAGNFEWKDISPDNIHPNDVGHRMLGEFIVRFMQDTMAEIGDEEITSEPFDGSMESPTGDKYKDATLADKNSELVTVTDAGDFTEESTPWNFPDGWRASEGGSITFEMEFKNLGMLYYMTIDGNSGIASVTVDGVEIADINADFTGGWGDYAANQEIVSFDEKGKHTVTVKSSEGKSFEILRWMIS